MKETIRVFKDLSKKIRARLVEMKKLNPCTMDHCQRYTENLQCPGCKMNKSIDAFIEQIDETLMQLENRGKIE